MSPDSLDQYQQSLSGQYSDWHPPVMAALWRMLHWVWEGPGSLLILQLSAFWLSIGLLLRSAGGWLQLLLYLLCPWLPFFYNFEGYIIKDVQMCFAFLLAFALLIETGTLRQKQNWLPYLLSLVCITYGVMVRINAFPAAVPLLWLWYQRAFDGKYQRPAYRHFARFALLLLGVGAANLFVNKIVLHPDRSYAEHKLFLHDLSAIYVASGDATVFPPSLLLQPGFDTLYIRSHYHPATFDNIWWNEDHRSIKPARPAEDAIALKQAWKKAVLTYPVYYLRHRAEGLLYYLRIKKRSTAFNYNFPWISPNPFGFRFHPNALSNVLITDPDQARDRLYFQPWFWILLNIILLVIALLYHSGTLRCYSLVLLWSSLLYQLPAFFLFQTDTDFRYFYWNCIACSLALILLVPLRPFKGRK